MYVKINLLPKSYYEKRAAKILSAFLLVVFVAVVGGLFFYKIKFIDKEINELNQKIAYAQDIKQKVDALNAEVEQRKADVAYYTKRVDFMKSVLRFNKSIPKIFEDVAKWTYEKVQYQSLNTDGSSVTIRGRSRSLDDVGRYILNLYKAQSVFNSVTLSVDGFGGSSGVGRMGMPGGMSSPMPGRAPGMPGMSSPGGMPGSMSPPMSVGAPGMPSPGGMPGSMSPMPGGISRMPGMSGNQGSTFASSGGWINFTINASLRNPISAPQWSDGGTTQGGGNMNYGMPGYGMPGMSAGMPGGMPPPSVSMPNTSGSGTSSTPATRR